MAEYKPIALKPLSEEGSKEKYSNVGKSASGEKLKGGKADNKPDEDFDKEQLAAGIKVEREHTSDPDKAKEVAKDHLTEIPDYYKRLKVMESKADKEVKKSLERADSLVKALKESLSEEDMDLKKNDDEEEEEEKTEKSFGPLDLIVKALKASAIIGLSRRQRLNAAYRAGVLEGSKSPLYTEIASLETANLGLEPKHVRPDYEPPAVPVRRVETPFEIPPKKCGDHTYKSAEAGPTESKPFWSR